MLLLSLLLLLEEKNPVLVLLTFQVLRKGKKELAQAMFWQIWLLPSIGIGNNAGIGVGGGFLVFCKQNKVIP